MRLRFLLDENVPRSVLRVLKRKGFDAVEVTDLKPAGLRNSEVAELAVKESRFIVTLDSDFLRLRREMLEKLKVIFINVHPRDPSRIAELVDAHISDCIELLKRRNAVILTEEGVQA